jgi:hypothetical protein
LLFDLRKVAGGVPLESTQPPDGFMYSLGRWLLKQVVDFAKDLRARQIYIVHAFVNAVAIGFSGRALERLLR